MVAAYIDGSHFCESPGYGHLCMGTWYGHLVWAPVHGHLCKGTCVASSLDHARCVATTSRISPPFIHDTHVYTFMCFDGIPDSLACPLGCRYQTPSGTDINKIGIAPTIKLAPEEMPPFGPDGFCSAMQGPSAPHLFK